MMIPFKVRAFYIGIRVKTLFIKFVKYSAYELEKKADGLCKSGTLQLIFP